MRYPGLFLACLFLAACASQDKEVTACSEPRPQVCTMEYSPACGVLVAGGTRDYSSGCNACADTSVAGYTQGACDAQD